MKQIKKYLFITSALAFMISSAPIIAEEQSSQTALAPQMMNLKNHEKQFNAYFERMNSNGSFSSLSNDFLEVHQGMKEGNYMYDMNTMFKVFAEVYPHFAPCPCKRQMQIETAEE